MSNNPYADKNRGSRTNTNPNPRGLDWDDHFPSTGRKKVCFVATVAFESDIAPEVVFLRRYRDTALRNHFWGKAFIEIYYRMGPHLAAVIGRSEFLKRVSRYVLRKLIGRLHDNRFR